MRRRCQREPGGVARYSYEDLHRFADRIQDRLRQSVKVGKIEQIGVLDEAVYLYYSNRRLGPFGIDLALLGSRLQQRNSVEPGGTAELPRQNLAIKASGKLKGDGDLGSVVIDVRDGSPLYLRDLVEVVRGYEDPPRVLNFRTIKADAEHSPAALGAAVVAAPSSEHDESARPPGGKRELWTERAITLAIRQVKGTQIADFSREVDAGLESLRGVLPDDLRIERTSDEPARVGFKISEFNDCLAEAIAIVVLVALVFMEWRSALIIALSIPITLAMTFVFCAILGVDLQQISISALIIALGLLVDDPVVAGDAINRELAAGVPRDVAAWLGPQKLSRAILYATITNCAAFMPLLVVSGGVGEFIWSLPVVVTASLVASRLVSMTFIPLLGFYILRGQKGLEAGVGDGSGGSRFARIYNGFSEVCMEHKWASLTVCLVALGAGLSLLPLIGTNLFPKDLHSAFTVNLFLPEGSSIRESKAEAMAAIRAIDDLVGDDVEAYTTFIGAGGPRFWLSIVPEQSASNYAQVMVHTRDKHQTYAVAEKLKRSLPPRMTVARVHVQALESGPPIGIPVQIRVMGSDIATIRRLGEQLKGFMREAPGAESIQDDWDPEYLQIGLQVDPDRANVSGVSHQDIARLMNGALSGFTATTIRERDRLIPVMLKLRPDERARVEEMRSLNVASLTTGAKVPLDQISSFRPEFVPPKICRRDNERCMTVKADVAPGLLASKIYDDVEAKLAVASKDWPAGYHYQIGGEKEEQAKGFGSLAIAMVVSIISIYIALILQFNSLTKPLVVFAAVPFGMVGGLMGLLVFGVPLGFFALLGVSALVG